MKTYILVDPDGRIASAQMTNSVLSSPYILVPTFPDVTNSYWDGIQVVSLPAPPGNAYAWDWPSKAWVLNLTAGQLAAWSRIKAARDAAINAGVTYNGNVYDSDAKAQLRVTGAATLAQLAIASGNTTYSITWTLQNNSTVSLTAQQVIAMAQAVGTNYQTQFAKGQTLRAQIMAATTQAQLDAVAW